MVNKAGARCEIGRIPRASASVDGARRLTCVQNSQECGIPVFRAKHGQSDGSLLGFGFQKQAYRRVFPIHHLPVGGRATLTVGIVY